MSTTVPAALETAKRSVALPRGEGVNRFLVPAVGVVITLVIWYLITLRSLHALGQDIDGSGSNECQGQERYR